MVTFNATPLRGQQLHITLRYSRRFHRAAAVMEAAAAGVRDYHGDLSNILVNEPAAPSASRIPGPQ